MESAFLDQIIETSTTDEMMSIIDRNLDDNVVRAAMMLKRSIDLRPDEPRFYVKMGDIFFDYQADLDTAEKFYKKALEIEQYPGIYCTLGWVSFERGDLKTAESRLIHAMNVSRQPGEINELGEFYLKTGRLSNAILLLNGVKSRIKKKLEDKTFSNPEWYVRVCHNLIDAYLAKGDMDSYESEMHELYNSPIFSSKQ